MKDTDQDLVSPASLEEQEREKKNDFSAGLIHQTIPTGDGTEPRPIYSDYWQCNQCSAVLYSPTTGLAILDCWNCHKQDWRPILKPGLTPYRAWCEIRKEVTLGWSAREMAAADIAVAKLSARLAAQTGCVSVVNERSESSALTPERSAKDLLLNESKPRPNKETV
jgi:hypothetical protein